MKKFLAILLTLALTLTLAGALAGCKREVKPLRVLIDLENAPGVENSYSMTEISESIQTQVELLGGPTDIEFEFVPREGAERDGVLTRIRTEVMAGQGPDVYLVSCAAEVDTASKEWTNSALFLMPEKSMELGLFMPLDSYIENAQFMEWDKLTSTVMQAGRNERYGQMILPLVYEFPATFFSKETVDHTPSSTATWDDMITDDSVVMQAAAVNSYIHLPYGSDMFGKLADYSKKELSFSEDELKQRILEYMTLQEKADSGAFEELLPFQQYRMVAGYNSSDYFKSLFGKADSEVTIVPGYSVDGGVTATVHAFAAVNANTKRADDAFFVLDVLFSHDFQQNSSLYRRLTNAGGLPTYDGLMTEDDPITDIYGASWSMTPENYKTFCEARDCITHVKFCGSLDVEIFELLVQCEMEYASPSASSERIDDLIHKYYTRMKRELSE